MSTSPLLKSGKFASPSSTLDEEQRYESSLSEPHHAGRGSDTLEHISRTDWDQVCSIVSSSPHTPYDSEDGPYDPNDDIAVDNFWNEAIVTVESKKE